MSLLISVLPAFTKKDLEAALPNEFVFPEHTLTAASEEVQSPDRWLPGDKSFAMNNPYQGNCVYFFYNRRALEEKILLYENLNLQYQ